MFGATACDDAKPAASAAAVEWPAGTAIAIDDVPIAAEQVDLDSVYVERIEPAASPAQLRRLAVTNLSIPRVLARMMNPAAYETARADAQERLASLRAGTLHGPLAEGQWLGEAAEGGWSELGLCVWGTAMDLADGEWSDVIEEPGHFAIVRRIERHEGPVPMATRVTVDAMIFRWLDGPTVRADIEAEHDKRRLTIVDPQWRAIVPELLQYRMGVHQP